jgi:exopolysaccharide biosynthesis polyprenyl glycosylphosphotransferase
VLADPEVDEVKRTIGNPGVDEVILANPNYPTEKVSDIVDLCNENHVTFKYVPNIHQLLTTHFAIDVFSGVPVIELRRTALDGWGRVMKRVGDIVVAGAALIILSPLFLVVAFLIKWDSEGPVFVHLRRASRNREFDLVKFRSMINNAHILNPFLRTLGNDRSEAGPLWKMKNDPRVTKVGRWIRRTRLDEMPQFWNVLKGDMSLVGPRPHQPDEIARYEKHHKMVLAIKAGVTGLAQISGSSDLPFEEEVRLDTFYIENWSLWLDLKIIVRTALKMFFDRSAV